jgi:hypothetical protein
MKSFFLSAVCAVMASVAFAQQPPQMSPSQTAIAITNAVNQMAVALDQLVKENAELKKQLSDKQTPQTPNPPELKEFPKGN